MPVVVLTKSDLCEDVHNKMSEVFSVAAGVDSISVSAYTGEGIEDIGKYFSEGKNSCFARLFRCR